MTDLKLPALSGDSPLGILAAIGVLRLLSEFSDESPRLHWDPADLTAVLRVRYDTLEEITAELQRIVSTIADGAVLPGVPAGFPPPGAAPDALRVPQMTLREFGEHILSDMTAVERQEASQWLASLVTDLVPDDQGRVSISQYTAPSGRQSMATMFAKPLEQIQQNPDYLRQALTAWRRVPGVTGEYLDHRALWDAAEDGAGTATTRGVPGATWLALMSYPVFRTTVSSRKRPLSSGWHLIQPLGSRTYEELRLPVWKQPLGVHAVTALVEHQAMASFNGDSEAVGLSKLEPLGIIRICQARRYLPPGGKSAGVLRPVDS